VHKKFNFNLKICGDGPLIELLNNQRNINYLGFLSNEDVNSELAKTKFLIFPSKCYEGFPTIILKAFQFETVVLAPALGSISAIIKDGYNGILFKPNNIEDLINKIKWVLSNEEKCNQIKHNAKKEFNEKYTEKVNYNILKKIYEDAIEENKNN
jgi:glycosyltransferase involved in cell wall biosynthesis